MNIVEQSPIPIKFYKYAAIAAAIFIPLSISLTYVALLPVLLAMIISKYSFKKLANTPLLQPLLLLTAYGVLVALFGINAQNSLVNLARLAFILFAVIFFADACRLIGINRLLPYVFIASSIAAFHTLLEGAFPEQVTKLFIGTVTESGQLALLIPCIVGYVFALNLELQNKNNIKLKLSKQDLCYAGLAFLIFISIGFSGYFQVTTPLKLLLLLLATVLYLPNLIITIGKMISADLDIQQIYGFCLKTASPLLTAALLVNLKRGPWVGVTIALLIFFFFYHRRLIIPAVLGLFAVTFTITPITERLAQSSSDFFILGGRSTIWEVGTELAIQYPLGIGFTNSGFLREFAPEVPPELVHFHNNFLNILVEFGWLGLILFLWWIFELLKFCFAERKLDYKSLLARGIGCSFIAWQIAGVIEYNFGDSEVMILVFFLLALVLANNGIDAKKTSSLIS